jgi:hypothetical protein
MEYASVQGQALKRTTEYADTRLLGKLCKTETSHNLSHIHVRLRSGRIQFYESASSLTADTETGQEKIQKFTAVGYPEIVLLTR